MRIVKPSVASSPGWAIASSSPTAIARVLLTAPAVILMQRLMARAANGYGRSEEQRAQVLADLADVEPLLRRSADLIIVTTQPTPLIADALLSHVLATGLRS